MFLPDVIILAAGKSHRMGKINKLLLSVNAQTLLNRSLGETGKIRAGKKIVITGYEASRVKDLVDTSRFEIVHNPNYEDGMTSSIQAGIRELTAQSTGVMILPADMPFVNAPDLQQLFGAFSAARAKNDKTIAVAVDKGTIKNPAIFSSHYYHLILQHKNPNGCKQIVEQNMDHVVKVAINNPYFFRDIDTPEDYQEFLNETAGRDH
jgi:molybdenum cofactor cytidylyltransferase